MELLDFARGPALKVALVIFVAGTLWRVLGMVLLPWIRIASEPRAGAPGAARRRAADSPLARRSFAADSLLTRPPLCR